MIPKRPKIQNWWDRNKAPIQGRDFTVIFPFVKPWVAKSVTMPVLEASEGAYRMGNHVYKYPGQQSWSDVTITFVDDGEIIEKLFLALTAQGYYMRPGNESVASGAMIKGQFDIQILQHRYETETLDLQAAKEIEEADKKPTFFEKLGFKKQDKEAMPIKQVGVFHYGANQWALRGAWIKSINFGTHDYSSDELITMEVTVAYDFPVVMYGQGQKREF